MGEALLKEPFLRKVPQRTQSQDYAFLRKEGLKHIEQLAHVLWTDYNIHDPGITILEHLCYAITDLGYRTSYDIQDLLTETVKGQPVNQANFHKAREVLTTNPISFDDLRKVLIDIQGVKNAWIEEHSSIKYFLDEKRSALTNTQGLKSHISANPPLNGLYDVLIDYDDMVEPLHLGILSDTPESGGYVAPADKGISFHVTYALTLEAVSVYAETDGQLEIQLLPGTSNIPLYTKVVDVPYGGAKYRIPLKMHIPPGDNYRLVATSRKSLKLLRKPDPQFPYAIDHLVYLVSGVKGEDLRRPYYFFYDWEVSADIPHRAYLDQKGFLLVGLPEPQGEGEFIETEDKGIIFEVSRDVLLEQVTIFPETSGNVVVRLLDSMTHEVLDTHEHTMTAVSKSVDLPLNFSLQSGILYRLDAAGTTVKLKRDTVVSYTVFQKSPLRLQQGFPATNEYYFFYHWALTYPLLLPNRTTSSVGLPDRQGQDGFIDTQNKGIHFEVFRDLTLEKVTVYPEPTQTMETIVIRLVDVTTEVELDSCTHQHETVADSVDIFPKFQLKPGTVYRLDAQGTTVRLFRNAGVTYPQTEPTIIRLIQGFTSQSINYFFYNWVVSYPTFPQPTRLSPGEVRWAVKHMLHTHRNLCEDFVNVCDLATEDIALCADLEVKPSVDVDKVLAKVFYQLGHAISPRVRFYTLNEMLAKGQDRKELLAMLGALEDLVAKEKPSETVLAMLKRLEELAKKVTLPKAFFATILVLRDMATKATPTEEWLTAIKPLKELVPKGKGTDQIFEGPPLTHGFIDDEEFQSLRRQCEIRASDVIQRIMDVPGVLAVKNLSLLRFVDGVLRDQQPWVLLLATEPFRAPEFSPDRSKVIFYKNDLPYYPNRNRVHELLKEQRASDIPSKLKSPDLNLPIPSGKDRQLEIYYPIQNEFPANYRVGKLRVAESEPSLRKAQSRQLKAYLLFFEQLLANYLSQLANVRKLFSWEPGKAQTYFTQPVYDVAELGALYLEEGIMSTIRKANEAHPVLRTQPTELSADEREEHLLQSLLPIGLDTIIEDRKTAEERKERILDHLLARFAESFTDYSLLMFNILKVNAPGRVIEDKRLFLEHFPGLSRCRSTAYDYRAPDASDNLSGFQHRVYRLLGIRNVQRDDLAGSRLCVQPVEGSDTHWHFVLTQPGQDHLFESIACDSKEAIEMLLDFALKIGGKDDNYYIDDAAQVYQLVQLCPGQEKPRVIGNMTSRDETEKNEVMAYFRHFGNMEGFHVVENVLLRQRTTDDPFLDVQLSPDEACDCVDVRDPYSFRLTILLPSWSSRFEDLKFRRFVEQTIRLEVPAHIYPKICWISHDQMKEFEACYRLWANHVAALTPSMARCRTVDTPVTDWSLNGELPLPKTALRQDFGLYQTELQDLITKLHGLVTVFPLAQLHDCTDVSSDTPQVSLNNTNLGTL